MQSSNTFIKTSGRVTEVKKSVLINDWDNISHWEEPEQRNALKKKVCLLQILLGVLGELQPWEIFVIFTLI